MEFCGDESEIEKIVKAIFSEINIKLIYNLSTHPKFYSIFVIVNEFCRNFNLQQTKTRKYFAKLY